MINKFTLVGYIFGGLVIILSIWRWWFVFYDPSVMVTYILGGCFIIGFAYIYQTLKNKEKEYEEIKKDIEVIEYDFNKILTWKNRIEQKEEK